MITIDNCSYWYSITNILTGYGPFFQGFQFQDPSLFSKTRTTHKFTVTNRRRNISIPRENYLLIA